MVISNFVSIIYLLIIPLLYRPVALSLRPPSTTLRINDEWLSWVGCLDYHQAAEFLSLKNEALVNPLTLSKSIDLNFSTSLIALDERGLSLSENLLATWDEIEYIANRKGCYSLYDDGSKPFHVTAMSKNTGIPASLCPPLDSSGAPTMVLGGFTMHRIAGGVNPSQDTEAKLLGVQLFPGGKVLDTCLGLGYTAIAAAKKVASRGDGGSSVTVIEYDEASVEMCAHNPWSRALFDGSLPINILQGDACSLVKEFEPASFNAVIHDPPARALCRTNLYGLEFYKDLRRLLTTKGTLFHYIGNPDSKESGRLYSGITSRLKEAGFGSVKKVTRAFGLTATLSHSFSATDTRYGAYEDDE